MEYVIEAEVRIEFKRLVDRFDYKCGEEFDGFKYEPVQDAAKRYSDGEDRFLKMFDYLLPLLDQIGEYDHSKWMSICSTGSVVSFDGEYFSSAKIEFNMRQNASMEFLENLKQRFDDSDYYHVTRSLTDKIMPKGCHAEITDIFMDDRLL